MADFRVAGQSVVDTRAEESNGTPADMLTRTKEKNAVTIPTKSTEKHAPPKPATRSGNAMPASRTARAKATSSTSAVEESGEKKQQADGGDSAVMSSKRWPLLVGEGNLWQGECDSLSSASSSPRSSGTLSRASSPDLVASPVTLEQRTLLSSSPSVTSWEYSSESDRSVTSSPTFIIATTGSKSRAPKKSRVSANVKSQRPPPRRVSRLSAASMLDATGMAVNNFQFTDSETEFVPSPNPRLSAGGTRRTLSDCSYVSGKPTEDDDMYSDDDGYTTSRVNLKSKSKQAAKRRLERAKDQQKKMGIKNKSKQKAASKKLEQEDLLAVLPFKLAFYLLGFLDIRSIRDCLLVNRFWHTVATRVLLNRRRRKHVPGVTAVIRNGKPEIINPNYARMRKLYLPRNPCYFIPREIQEPEVNYIQPYSNDCVPKRKLINLAKHVDLSGKSKWGYTLHEANACLMSYVVPQENLIRVGLLARTKKGSEQVYLEEQHVYCGNYEVHSITEGSESTYLAQGISGCDILAFTESGLYIRFYDLSAGQIEVNGVMILAVEQQVTGMKKVDNVSKRIWCNGGRIRCLRIDPRSESVFIGSSNNAVYERKLRTGAFRKKFTGHGAPVTSIDVTEKHLVSGSRDHYVKVWNRISTECLHSYHHSHIVNAVKFLDESNVVSGTGDGKVFHWCIGRKKPVRILWSHNGPVNALATGEKLFASGGNHFTIVWSNAHSCDAPLAVLQNPVPVTCLEITYLKLLAGSADGKVRLWNLVSGDLLRVLHHFREGDLPVKSIFLDGRRGIFICRSDGISLFRFLEGHEPPDYLCSEFGGTWSSSHSGTRYYPPATNGLKQPPSRHESRPSSPNHTWPSWVHHFPIMDAYRKEREEKYEQQRREEEKWRLKRIAILEGPERAEQERQKRRPQWNTPPPPEKHNLEKQRALVTPLNAKHVAKKREEEARERRHKEWLDSVTELTGVSVGPPRPEIPPHSHALAIKLMQRRMAQDEQTAKELKESRQRIKEICRKAAAKSENERMKVQREAWRKARAEREAAQSPHSATSQIRAGEHRKAAHAQSRCGLRGAKKSNIAAATEARLRERPTTTSRPSLYSKSPQRRPATSGQLVRDDNECPRLRRYMQRTGPARPAVTEHSAARRTGCPTQPCLSGTMAAQAQQRTKPAMVLPKSLPKGHQVTSGLAPTTQPLVVAKRASSSQVLTGQAEQPKKQRRLLKIEVRPETPPKKPRKQRGLFKPLLPRKLILSP
ncbi:uncharacterized protein LOC135805355 [Sycon ciliatum]|uniref:uncharacterized protein LOC135805355 n=1 Tax=Sycon ciliatum TaxID=27933 RepID=UPI0031F6D9C3